MRRIWKWLVPVLALTMLLTACGGNTGNSGGEDGGSAGQAPDLTKYYEDYMASLGEDNTPMMMDLTEDTEFLDSYYPGLSAVETKQLVAQTAAISAVACEFVLVEAADEAGAKTVADILQARLDSQRADGMMYPMVMEAWENAEILTNGNVVALICAGEQQQAAVNAFNALF